MNKYTDDLLNIDSFTPLSCACKILKAIEYNNNELFRSTIKFYASPDMNHSEATEWKYTFICFLAAMSDRDLIEMNFTPGDSV